MKLLSASMQDLGLLEMKSEWRWKKQTSQATDFREQGCTEKEHHFQWESGKASWRREPCSYMDCEQEANLDSWR